MNTFWKNSSFFLILAALSLIGFQLWWSPSEITPEEKEMPQNPEPSLSDPVPLSKSHSGTNSQPGPSQQTGARSVMPRIPNLPTLSSTAPAFAQREAENVVSFRVIDGLAVAQGDIVLGQVEGDWKESEGLTQVPPIERWKDPRIPFVLNPQFPNRKDVMEVLTYLSNHSALQFVPFSGELDAIVFQETKEHCFSFLGKTGGLQPILLSKQCGFQEILHEILHTLGFIHEHSRTDRDQYVEVLWSHVQPPYESQFKKSPDLWMDFIRDRPFDYQSVMIYAPNSFSKKTDPQPTLRSKTTTPIVPTRKGLSTEDLSRLQELFGY